MKEQLWDVKMNGRDFTIVGGDVQLTSSFTELLDQSIINALECRFNSMPEIHRAFGFEARGIELSRSNPKYGRDRQKVYMFLGEILHTLTGFLILDIQKVDPTWNHNNTFIFRLICTLNDMEQTQYDKTFTFNNNNFRATVT